MLSRGARRLLKKAGWSEKPSRTVDSEGWASAVGSRWSPYLSDFLLRFGGLCLPGGLDLNSEPHHVDDTPRDIWRRLEVAIGVPACPIGASNYLGEGAVLFLDIKGRFYACDRYELDYIASEMDEAMEVLLGERKPGTTPAEIQEGLRRDEMANGENL